MKGVRLVKDTKAQKADRRSRWDALAMEAYGRLDRLGDAARAVGSTPERRLWWLGDFAHQELSTFENQEVAAAALNRFLDVDPEVRRVKPAEVSGLQAAVRGLLAGLTPESVVRFPEPIVDGLAWSPGAGVFLRTTRDASLVQITITSVVELLRIVGADLQRCGACQRLFAQTRPQQRFCSTGCRVTGWRDRNSAQLAERRHGQYARKKKTQLPGVRVTRRSRMRGK